MELGLFREQYDALVADLEAEGHDVELVPPEEYRTRIPDAQTVYDLVVHARESPEYPLVVGALIAMIGKRLRGRLGRRVRNGVIHLPNGNEHRFEIPDESADGDDVS